VPSATFQKKSRAAGMVFVIFLFKQSGVHGHSRNLHKFLDIKDTLL